MVIVPNIAPDTPPLKSNPVFLYAQDRFQKPQPFECDITVDITDVFDQKIFAMAGKKMEENGYWRAFPNLSDIRGLRGAAR